MWRHFLIGIRIQYHNFRSALVNEHIISAAISGQFTAESQLNRG
jgi:hypothetical protein